MGTVKKGVLKIYSYKKLIFTITIVMAVLASAFCLFKYLKHSNAVEYDLYAFQQSNGFGGYYDSEKMGYIIYSDEGMNAERDFCAESSYTLLPKGEYTIAIAYESEGDNSVFIQGGDSLYKEYHLPAGDHIEYLPFELNQSVEDLRARFYYGGYGTLLIKTMIIQSEKPLMTDWLFVMALMWIAVAFIIKLEKMYFNHKLTKEHLFEILFVIAIAGLSIPYVILSVKGLIVGYDTNAHNIRIEGLKDAILGGQFPVVIMPSLCNGYGSIEPMMYPSLFLYPFAFLRILNVSPVMVSKFAHILVNLLTCSTCYVCAKKITRSRKGAGVALLAFAFSKFHLMTIGCRDWTYGMGIAAIFFFVVLIGVYEVFLGEKEEWPYLALGMWGIINSHIVTVLFAVIVVGIFALVYLKKAIKEDRLKYFIYAVISSALICAYRIYTFLDSVVNNKINTTSMNLDIYEESVYYVVDALRRPMIFLGVAGVLFILLYLIVIKNRFSNGNKFAITSLCISAVCILMMSGYLPWSKMFANELFKKTYGYIQFPNRLMQIITPLVAISLGIAYRNLRRNNNVSYKICMGILLTIVCVSSVWSYKDELNELGTRGRAFTTKITGDVLSFPGMTDYVPEGEDVESYSGRTPYYSNENIAINEETYQKNGINIYSEIMCNEDDSYIDFPVFGYKGYVCEDLNGNVFRTGIGKNSRLRVYFDKSENPIRAKIYYHVPVMYYIMLFVSYFSMFIMITINRRFLGRTKERVKYYERLRKPVERIYDIDFGFDKRILTIQKKSI